MVSYWMKLFKVGVVLLNFVNNLITHILMLIALSLLTAYKLNLKHYGFETEAHPIKFRKLPVEWSGKNNKSKKMNKKSLSDTT